MEGQMQQHLPGFLNQDRVAAGLRGPESLCSPGVTSWRGILVLSHPWDVKWPGDASVLYPRTGTHKLGLSLLPTWESARILQLMSGELTYTRVQVGQRKARGA